MKRMLIVLMTIMVTTAFTVVICYGDVINGCKQKINGQLRIVNNPDECRNSELPVSWNQTGVANGITTAVHGLYSYTGGFGTGFTIDHIGVGKFVIHFDTAFTDWPTCVVTVAYPNIGGQTCNVAVNPGYFNVNCFKTSIEAGELTYTLSDPNAFFFTCIL